MKLAIDFGNTLKKFALFEGDELKELFVYDKLDLGTVTNLFQNYPIKASILSSVIDYPGALTKLLSSQSQFMVLSANTLLPINLNYDTPETLGKDRIAAAVAASHLFPEQNLLVVNAGTCITYDIISTQKEYYGGAISPGIDMRFRALNTFTEYLPLIEKSDDIPLLGKSTRGSIESGVQLGVIAELDGMIDGYRQEHEDLMIILSGGDAKYFDKKLKNNIFAVPNIVLRGLNIILDFNV